MTYRLLIPQMLTVISESVEPFNKRYEHGTAFELIQRDSGSVLLKAPDGETVFLSADRMEYFEREGKPKIEKGYWAYEGIYRQ